MKLPDHVMYLVVQHHRKGPYIPETDLDRTGLVMVCKDLREHQYEKPIAVIELDLINHTCREATHDFKDLIPD